MNQLMLPLPVAQQDFYTAAELAAFAKARGIQGFPATERGARAFADREAWNALPAHLARLRRAPGGGRPAMEYHYSILPEILQRTIHGMAAKASLVQRIAAEGDADRRKMAALKASMLTAPARLVMEARAEILISIENHAAAHGLGRGWAIGEFLEAQNAFRNRQPQRTRQRQHVAICQDCARVATRFNFLTRAECILGL
jgi:putative transposase